MATKKSNLNIVDQQTTEEAERRRKRSEEYDRWEKAQDSLRITAEEARRRVQELREELTRYRDQMEALPFEIPNQEPACLDLNQRPLTVNLVENFDTRIKGLLEMIDGFARQYGCAEVFDFNETLRLLTIYTAEAGFKIGVLHGAICAGASDREIDKLERGLVFSLESDRRIVDD